MKILRKILWFIFGFFYHIMYCLIWGNLGSQYMRNHTLSNKTCITVNEFDEFIEGTGSPISSSSHGQSWIKIFVAIYETWKWKCMSNFLDENTSTTVYKKGLVISNENDGQPQNLSIKQFISLSILINLWIQGYMCYISRKWVIRSKAINSHFQCK